MGAPTEAAASVAALLGLRGWVVVSQEERSLLSGDERNRGLQHALRTQLNNILSFAALLLYDAERAGDREFAEELGAIEREGRQSLEFIARIAYHSAQGVSVAEGDVAAAKALANSIRRRVWRLQSSPAASDEQVGSDLQRIGSSAQRLAALLRSVASDQA